MKSLLSFALICLTIPVYSQDYSLFEKKSFTSKDGQALPYRILFPENYDQSKSYPLVVFLHGAGERGNDNEKQLIHGVKTFLDTAARRKFPCIVIAPQCPAEDYWGSVKVGRSSSPPTFDFNYSYKTTKALDATIELIKQTIKKEAVDKNRVYITGLSMGGMGTLEALYRQPKLFAAAVAVCGGADVEAYGKKQAKIPLWLFHGSKDSVVDVVFSQNLYDKMKQIHAKIKYKEYPGVDHNSWDNAYAEPELLPWLFKQKR